MTRRKRLPRIVCLIGLAAGAWGLAGCEKDAVPFAVDGPESKLVVCQRDKKPVMVEFFLRLEPGVFIRSIDDVELVDAKNVELSEAALTEWALGEDGQLVSLGHGLPIGKNDRVYGVEVNEEGKLVTDVQSSVLWKDRQSFPTGQVGPFVEDEPAPLLTVVLEVPTDDGVGKIGGITVRYTTSVGVHETATTTADVEVLKDKNCGAEPEEKPKADD